MLQLLVGDFEKTIFSRAQRIRGVSGVLPQHNHNHNPNPMLFPNSITIKNLPTFVACFPHLDVPVVQQAPVNRQHRPGDVPGVHLDSHLERSSQRVALAELCRGSVKLGQGEVYSEGEGEEVKAGGGDKEL